MLEIEIGYKMPKISRNIMKCENLTETQAVELENFYYEVLRPITRLKLKDLGLEYENI